MFMKNTISKCFAIGLLLCNANNLQAQNTVDSTQTDSAILAPASVHTFTGTKNFRTFSIGVNAGGLAPVVPIGGSNDFTNWQASFGYGAYIKNQFRHNFALQLDFLKGQLQGNNDNALGNGTKTDNPNSSFKTDLNWALSLSGELTFGNINWLNKKIAVVPFVSAGGGLASYNPTLITNDNTQIDYKPDGSIKEFFIPVGGGIKINAAPGLNIDLGYRMNFVDGDNLDGYYRSSGIHKDKFSYGYAGLEFVLGNKSKPQLMTNNPVASLQQDLMDENLALRSKVEASEHQTQMQATELDGLKQDISKLKSDADGDGVADYFDKCANTAAGVKVDGSGCPLPKPEVIKEEPKVVITEEDRRIVNEAIKNLEFDFGKATIRSSSFPSLDKVAEILVKKNFSLKLAGHTDNVGSESANMKLSKDRAEAVKAYLVSKGANPSRIEATGYGETQPIASNKTAEGRQQNRRVEFTLY